MACQLYRKDGKIEKVLAPNGKESILYNDLLKEVKDKGVSSFLTSIPYLKNRIADGTLLNDSPEEIAVGLWSIAYSPEYQSYFNNMNKELNAFGDANGEPKFFLFNKLRKAF